MNIPDWVGKHFIIGLEPSAHLTSHDARLLSALRPIGVALFRPNFQHEVPYAVWTETLKRLLEDVRAAIGRPKIIVAIDHEGARVHRTPPPLTRFSYAADWADSAGEVGSAMGAELASIGVNLNFGPVLDIDSNPANPVIGKRAFGSDPGRVGDAAIAFMRGLQNHGVLTCGKHYPGHGDTTEDSHTHLPELGASLDLLMRRELLPFEGAILAGIPAIMSAHIRFPLIDPEWPATLSSPLVRGILRDRLKFGGAIISDDIGMRAMDRYFSPPDAAVRFLNAGSDIILVCSYATDTERALGFADALMAARSNGDLPDGALDASQLRIDSLAQRLIQHAVSMLPADVLRRHEEMGPIFRDLRSGQPGSPPSV